MSPDNKKSDVGIPPPPLPPDLPIIVEEELSKEPVTLVSSAENVVPIMPENVIPKEEKEKKKEKFWTSKKINELKSTLQIITRGRADKITDKNTKELLNEFSRSLFGKRFDDVQDIVAGIQEEYLINKKNYGTVLANLYLEEDIQPAQEIIPETKIQKEKEAPENEIQKEIKDVQKTDEATQGKKIIIPQFDPTQDYWYPRQIVNLDKLITKIKSGEITSDSELGIGDKILVTKFIRSIYEEPAKDYHDAVKIISDGLKDQDETAYFKEFFQSPNEYIEEEGQNIKTTNINKPAHKKIAPASQINPVLQTTTPAMQTVLTPKTGFVAPITQESEKAQKLSQQEIQSIPFELRGAIDQSLRTLKAVGNGYISIHNPDQLPLITKYINMVGNEKYGYGPDALKIKLEQGSGQKQEWIASITLSNGEENNTDKVLYPTKEENEVQTKLEQEQKQEQKQGQQKEVFTDQYVSDIVTNSIIPHLDVEESPFAILLNGADEWNARHLASLIQDKLDKEKVSVSMEYINGEPHLKVEKITQNQNKSENENKKEEPIVPGMTPETYARAEAKIVEAEKMYSDIETTFEQNRIAYEKVLANTIRNQNMASILFDKFRSSGVMKLFGGKHWEDIIAEKPEVAEARKKYEESLAQAREQIIARARARFMEYSEKEYSDPEKYGTEFYEKSFKDSPDQHAMVNLRVERYLQRFSGKFELLETVRTHNKAIQESRALELQERNKESVINILTKAKEWVTARPKIVKYIIIGTLCMAPVTAVAASGGIAAGGIALGAKALGITSGIGARWGIRKLLEHFGVSSAEKAQERIDNKVTDTIRGNAKAESVFAKIREEEARQQKLKTAKNIAATTAGIIAGVGSGIGAHATASALHDTFVASLPPHDGIMSETPVSFANAPTQPWSGEYTTMPDKHIPSYAVEHTDMTSTQNPPSVFDIPTHGPATGAESGSSISAANTTINPVSAMDITQETRIPTLDTITSEAEVTTPTSQVIPIQEVVDTPVTPEADVTIPATQEVPTPETVPVPQTEPTSISSEAEVTSVPETAPTPEVVRAPEVTSAPQTEVIPKVTPEASTSGTEAPTSQTVSPPQVESVTAHNIVETVKSGEGATHVIERLQTQDDVPEWFNNLDKNPDYQDWLHKARLPSWAHGHEKSLYWTEKFHFSDYDEAKFDVDNQITTTPTDYSYKESAIIHPGDNFGFTDKGELYYQAKSGQMEILTDSNGNQLTGATGEAVHFKGPMLNTDRFDGDIAPPIEEIQPEQEIKIQEKVPEKIEIEEITPKKPIFVPAENANTNISETAHEDVVTKVAYTNPSGTEVDSPLIQNPAPETIVTNTKIPLSTPQVTPDKIYSPSDDVYDTDDTRQAEFVHRHPAPQRAWREGSMGETAMQGPTPWGVSHGRTGTQLNVNAPITSGQGMSAGVGGTHGGPFQFEASPNVVRRQGILDILLSTLFGGFSK